MCASARRARAPRPTPAPSPSLQAGATIRDAMIIGADYYETDDQRAALRAEGKVGRVGAKNPNPNPNPKKLNPNPNNPNQVPIGVGSRSVVTNAIVDKNARIGADCVIANKAGIDEAAHEVRGRGGGGAAAVPRLPPSPVHRPHPTPLPSTGGRLLHSVGHRVRAAQRDHSRRDRDLKHGGGRTFGGRNGSGSGGGGPACASERSMVGRHVAPGRAVWR